MAENKSEQQPSIPEALGEAAGCLLPLLIVGLIFLLGFVSLQERAKQIANDFGVVAGELRGKVKEVKTWQLDEDPVVEKEGRMTLTLKVRDKTKITFEDGRSKEFFGMPKKPVPTDKEVVITHNKYMMLLEIVEAEEFDKRKKKDDPPHPPG